MMTDASLEAQPDQGPASPTPERFSAIRPPREPLRPGALAPWWQAGGRALVFRRVEGLQGLQATPAVVACLLLANILMSVLWQRLTMAGVAQFHWEALLRGWFDTAVIVWLCAWVRPPGLGAMRLLCVVLGLEFVLTNVTGPVWMVLAQADLGQGLSRLPWLAWALWAAPLLWWLGAMATLLWRLGDHHRGPWIVSVLAMAALLALQLVEPSPPVWSPVRPPDGQERRETLALTEPVLQAQATLLDRQLAALPAQRPGVVDLYVLTFAPYGDEDVFRRESAMVAEVMSHRFDAQGRSLQLVNHPATAEQLPWATPGNLQRALKRLGQVMNPKEDVLFIHLTSHGARNGQLATDLWPLQIAPVTPLGLKAWLDDAGIRHRVISISACYSGSWIEPLANDHALVMTAADAEHTSYGCGRHSELTFFGRAMYDELLRRHTRSFTEAHALARQVILQRETEAGKDDGYSNPQIRLGAAITPVLTALQRRLGP